MLDFSQYSAYLLDVSNSNIINDPTNLSRLPHVFIIYVYEFNLKKVRCTLIDNPHVIIKFSILWNAIIT